MKHRFAVIGYGRVGSAITALLMEAGYEPAWVVNSKQIALKDTPSYPSIPPEPFHTDIIFITVPDDHIGAVAADMAQRWGKALQGIIVYHLSGLLSSDILSPIADCGGYVASLHPLQSIMDPEKAKEALQGSFFTVEGDPAAVSVARDLVAGMGNSLLAIRKEDKVIYHTAAVIASNYLVSLISQSEELLRAIGLRLEHLLPLVRGTLANIEAHGKSALTGPIRRGDWSTVAGHIKALAEAYPDLLAPYVAMGRYTARLAGRSWPPDLDAIQKLLDWAMLTRKVETIKGRGLRIVFTNGCFDIIHAGHVTYLEQARALGDCLIIGLNSDDSVRRLKGPARPINDQSSRASVLSALACVDCIAIFEEDTPYNLINLVHPHVLVKGGDWKVEDIIGGDIVKSYGGEVLTIPFKDSHSTSDILEKMK